MWTDMMKGQSYPYAWSSTMQMYVEVAFHLHAFSTPSLDERDWLISCASCCKVTRRALQYHLHGRPAGLQNRYKHNSENCGVWVLTENKLLSLRPGESHTNSATPNRIWNGDVSTTANHNCAIFCKSRWVLHKSGNEMWCSHNSYAEHSRLLGCDAVSLSVRQSTLTAWPWRWGHYDLPKHQELHRDTQRHNYKVCQHIRLESWKMVPILMNRQ